MKSIIRIVCFFGFLLFLSDVSFADTSTVNRQTWFNDTTDFVATVGKDNVTKKEIVRDRKELRREARIKSEERRKKAAMRKLMKQQEADMMRKIQAPEAR